MNWAFGLFVIAGLLATLAMADGPGERPLHVFCGTGDHLWVREREPVDSPASIDAMLEWMSKTYGVSRIYWRGGQGNIWDTHYQFGEARPREYDWTVGWKRHLHREVGIDQAAIAGAHKRGMELFLYTGLLEHGVQPDVGMVTPYLFEDRLRIEHPEWCDIDRWGERRAPGPLCFGFPEVRAALVARYADWMQRFGYDGITFYTYVENVGIRYPKEFGFSQPVVDEFAKRYPHVDLRADELTEEQVSHWEECRGGFITAFLRELHQALAHRGMKLQMIVDAVDPGCVQPWWGKEIPGTGRIHTDWQGWIEEGIVDELWVQLASTADQQATLDRLLPIAKASGVELVVRAPAPFDATWKKYVQEGVTPVAVITAPRNGIERYALEPTSAETLHSEDWRLRLQTVADYGSGALKLPAASVASLAQDSNVLVRRRVMMALSQQQAQEFTSVIESGLLDEESSVRIAAAGSLAKLHGPQSGQKVIEAVASGARFQLKNACVEALAGMGEHAVACIETALIRDSAAVREACVRALYDLGKAGFMDGAWRLMMKAMTDPEQDALTKYWAIEGLTGSRLRITEAQRQAFISALLPELAAGNVTVQLHAAWGAGYMSQFMSEDDRAESLGLLANVFREYGEGCQRPDAAYGWREIGNAMLRYGPDGTRALEALRTGSEDKWIAWFAYSVVHAPVRSGVMTLVSDSEALEAHRMYAPPFPGWRRW